MDYQQAKKKVQALKGFYVHLAMYMGVMAFLFIINFLTGKTWWFYWPMIGWGIAVLLHGIAVIFDMQLFGSDWEEKKIKEVMGKTSEK